jgi:hypothetical protein
MSEPITSGDFEKVYIIDIESFMDFERVKVDLMQIKGVEDVSFNEEVTPHEITAFTNGAVADVILQEVIARHGFQATPKTFLIN